VRLEQFDESYKLSSGVVVGSEEEMALVLKGGEFVATEALSVSVLQGLMGLARSRPLLLNGLRLGPEDLARLAEEAERTGKPVWPQSLAGEAGC
jgi:hypothetical protein